jgi:hypothetical protein
MEVPNLKIKLEIEHFKLEGFFLWSKLGNKLKMKLEVPFKGSNNLKIKELIVVPYSYSVLTANFDAKSDLKYLITGAIYDKNIDFLKNLKFYLLDNNNKYYRIFNEDITEVILDYHNVVTNDDNEIRKLYSPSWDHGGRNTNWGYKFFLPFERVENFDFLLNHYCIEKKFVGYTNQPQDIFDKGKEIIIEIEYDSGKTAQEYLFIYPMRFLKIEKHLFIFEYYFFENEFENILTEKFNEISSRNKSIVKIKTITKLYYLYSYLSLKILKENSDKSLSKNSSSTYTFESEINLCGYFEFIYNLDLNSLIKHNYFKSKYIDSNTEYNKFSNNNYSVKYKHKYYDSRKSEMDMKVQEQMSNWLIDDDYDRFDYDPF